MNESYGKARYTVSEMDSMRNSVREILMAKNGGSYGVSDLDRRVEDQLRSHMLNGTTPQELDEARKKEWDRYQQRRRRFT